MFFPRGLKLVHTNLNPLEEQWINADYVPICMGARQYHRDLTTENGPFHLPEYLNINDTLFTYAIPFLLDRLSDQLSGGNDGENNWTLGIEETYRRTFNRYHGAPTDQNIIADAYGGQVLQFAGRYPPKKK